MRRRLASAACMTTRPLWLLVLLPFSLTYLHLKYTFRQNQWVIVQEPVKFAGIYRQQRTQGLTGILGQPRRSSSSVVDYRRIWSPSPTSCTNEDYEAPSCSANHIKFLDIVRLTKLLMNLQHDSDSIAYGTTEAEEEESPPLLSYVPETDEWKLRKEKNAYSKDLTIPSAQIQDFGFIQSIKSSFPSSSSQSTTTNRTLQQFLRTPTTFLLIAVNVFLCWLYWEYNIPISRVAINGEIFNDYGRAFSGSLAHFDLWHLGFNMMATLSLGQDLEASRYGSIPFLFWNITLIPVTVLLLVGLRHVYYAYFQHRFRRSATTEDEQRPSTIPPFPHIVGFSGVLFAWMVVASLDRGVNCPIPFLPDICFETHQIFGIRFNVAPLVQLVVAQTILPRSSFLGHLAGIVAGFAIHWELVPLEYAQPAILLSVLYLMLQSKVCSSGRSLNSVSSGQFHVSDDDDRSGLIRLRGLVLLLGTVVGIIEACVTKFAFEGFYVILSKGSLGAVCYLWYKEAKRATTGHDECTVLVSAAARAYIVLASLSLVTDCMTFAGISIMHSIHLFWQPKIFVLLICMISRTVLLCITSRFLCQSGERSPSNTIFWKVLGTTIIRPLHNLYESITFYSFQSITSSKGSAQNIFPATGMASGYVPDAEEESARLV